MSTQDPNKRHGSRYKARRRAVDILFEAEARDVDPVAIVEDRVELAQLPDPPVAPVSDYTRQLVAGVAEELDSLDALIDEKLSEDWTIERIPAVDRAILRLSCWEMLFNPDVPPKAALVDGIELAAQYSTDVAPPYINAVLDEVFSHLSEIRTQLSSSTEESPAESPTESPEE